MQQLMLGKGYSRTAIRPCLGSPPFSQGIKPMTHLYFEDAEVGTTCKAGPYLVPKEEIIQFAKRANEAPRQTGEKIQHPGPADPLADHHRAQPINPVNLEHRLRYIQTNRDNLAHGRLPSKWFASAQPPYGTPMPQSARRPQHH